MPAPRRATVLGAVWAVGCALLTPGIARAQAPPEPLDGPSVPTAMRSMPDAVRAGAPGDGTDGVASWLTTEVDAVVTRALARGAAPGAAVVVGHRGRIVVARGWGKTDPERGAPAATAETLWDLASLTKVVATTVAAMVLVEDGRLDLDRPLHDYLPTWPADGARGRVTPRHLLQHRSGLPPSAVLASGGKDSAIARIAALPLRSEPGAREVYGDLNMVLLGAALEAVAGESLDRFVERRVYARLGMEQTAFRPLDRGIARSRIAPTERLRVGQLHGTVHDPIARRLGGVAGNAGLFASALDLARFASALLWEQPERVVCRSVVDAFTRAAPGDRYALGWESTAPGTLWSEVLGPAAFGHTGYTGTSLWVDPERDFFVVLLTNRVNPSARNQRHVALRRELHETVVRALAGADALAGAASTPGIERFASTVDEAVPADRGRADSCRAGREARALGGATAPSSGPWLR